MGASEWEYVVPYQALQAALTDLRRQVFDSGEFISPVEWGLPAPKSVEDLTQQEHYREFMGDNGTHSIIDVLNVVPYDMGEQEPGTVCAFTDDESLDYFGSTRPTRADWDRFRSDPISHEYVAGRWTGRAMVLWEGDTPSEIAFWGYSGD